MLRPFPQIKIQQIPTPKWPTRNQNFILDFVTDYEFVSTWEKHTDYGKITFPKNIKLKVGQDGSLFSSGATSNLILGGSGTKLSVNTEIGAVVEQITTPPLIMKGDIITVNDGYVFKNTKGVDCVCSTGGVSIINTSKNNDLSTQKDKFFGYVSAVNSDTPIEITLEDNFYLLKRTPFDKTVWNAKEAKDGNTSLYALMKHILDLTNASFNSVSPSFYPKLSLLNIPNSITAQFSLGYLEIGDMTCAQLLDKLHQQYHFISTFKGNTLQFGFPIYVDSTDPDLTPQEKIQINALPSNLQANSNNFFAFRDIFNQNNQLQASANIFPTHDLEYINKDDVILSATVQCSVINIVPGKSTLSGLQKTKVEKLKAYIYWDIISQTFKSLDISKPGTPTPPIKDIGGEGERHQFYYPVSAKNSNPKISDLVRLGIAQLKKYHYTGFHGCFTTFGFPYVEWNDNVNILDAIYADRNGQYKVKKVVYRGGLKGISQQIYLDYRIDVPLPKNVKSISMI